MSNTNILNQYLQSPNNLFALLTRYRVLVPGIQRHYVQGANDPRAKNVRESFIASLFEDAKTGKELNLHFIYGPIRTEGEDAFTPVDGQQRLTTLWLLARYATERLEDRYEREQLLQLLSLFSYTERIHATRFCQELTSSAHMNTWDVKKDPKSSIPAQQWFWDYWLEDETVSSMLEMLSTIHTIHRRCYASLTGHDILEFIASKAHFELKVDAFGDDIYMKMNARGLQLTQWENFKGRFADLLSQEESQNASEYVRSYIARHQLDGKSIKEIWDIQIEKLSNDFYDRSASEDSGKRELPDNAFFALIARLTVYAGGGRCEGQIRKLSQLTNDRWDNIELPYVSFEDFKKVFCSRQDTMANDINIFAIRFLSMVENALMASDTLTPYWGKKRLFDAVFHPRNVNDCDFSIGCFEYFSVFLAPEPANFSLACRFMWNILENVTRANPSKDDERQLEWNRVRWIRACAELGDPTLYPANAIELLKEGKQHPSQIKEEVTKAEWLNANDGRAPAGWDGTWKGWGDAIRKAEEYAFFHGAIRFLYTNDRGDTDWKDFGVKFRNAQAYFEENGVRDQWGKAHGRKLLRRLISYFNKEDDFRQIYYDNSINNWRTYVLLNNKLAGEVHELLMTNDIGDFAYSAYESSIEDRQIRYFQKYLVRTRLLTKVCEGCEYHKLKDAGCVLYPGGARADWKKYVINPRLEIMIALKKDTDIEFRFENKDMNKEEYLDDGLLWGWSIPFYYKRKEDTREYRFVWHWYNWVDMYEGGEKLWDLGDSLTKKGEATLGHEYQSLHSLFTADPEQNKYPHFNSTQTLLAELDRCIMEYNRIKRETKPDD